MSRLPEDAVNGDVYIYDGEKFHHMVPPMPEQIVYLIKMADIADKLAEALEYVAADMNDSMPIPSDVIFMVTQALTAYRKAKGV